MLTAIVDLTNIDWNTVDWLAVFNTVALAVFLVEVVVAFARMFWRLGMFLFTGVKVPLLLKRDIFLFAAFAVYFGAIFVIRILDIPARNNPTWVVPTTILVLAAMGYWAKVEWSFRKEPEPRLRRDFPVVIPPPADGEDLVEEVLVPGPAGPKGDDGDRGRRGRRGAKGDAGPPGEVPAGNEGHDVPSSRT